MALKIEIISGALILIGANSISSITEGTEGEVANLLYEDTYMGLLANHSWRFATKKVSLSRLSSSPLNEFKYQYQLPTDMIVLQRVYTGGDYEIYGDKLYSDSTYVEIDYRYRVDETLLPNHFVLTLKYLLAAQFAIPITDNSQRAQVYMDMYERQLARAKYIDSSERPQDSITHTIITETE